MVHYSDNLHKIQSLVTLVTEKEKGQPWSYFLAYEYSKENQNVGEISPYLLEMLGP
jgi:hypothetical protein